MYEKTKTWNPAVGCNHNCIYCKPTFQRQLRRQKCKACQRFTPHIHPERLNKIPAGFPIIFVFGNGDLTFYPHDIVEQTIFKISDYISHKKNHHKKFYFQSKDPKCFEQYLDLFKVIPNVYLLTTLETNRGYGYQEICPNAPNPFQRYIDFRDLKFPRNRKIITIEPVLDFDVRIFFERILSINPSLVYLGYNSHPESVDLPDPPLSKVNLLEKCLIDVGIPVILKTMRKNEL